jgi:hypothetical protein
VVSGRRDEAGSVTAEIDGHGAPAPEPTLAGRIPTQRRRAAGEQGPARRRVTPVLVVAALLLAAGVPTAVAVDHAADQRAAAEAQARDEQAAAARRADAAAEAAQRTAAERAAQRTQAVSRLQGALESARAALGATTHAGDAHDALRVAVTTAEQRVADADADVAALVASAAVLPTAVTAAQKAETSWASAKAKKDAAAKKKAAQAKAQAAVLRQSAPTVSRAKAATSTKATTKTSTKTSTKKATTKTTTSTKKVTTKTVKTTSSSRVKALPKGSLKCQGSGGVGAYQSGSSAIGKAINAYRAKKGLKKLKIVVSSTMISHSKDMATRGGIWHSGRDKIVGCTYTGSASRLVTLWSRSAGHNYWLTKKGLTTMYVGGANNDGFLFGAVNFK